MPGSPDTTSPARLRACAEELRRVARAVDSADVSGVARRAGPDTWVGTGPARCAAELTSAARDVEASVARLRRRADELDRLAAQVTADLTVLGAVPVCARW